MKSATILRATRLVHSYVGVFFAPAILFFAVTGGLQMFGLHETSRGSSYLPPAVLVHLAQLHKKGSLYLPPRKTPPAAPAKSDPPKVDASPSLQKPASPAPPNPLPIKIFFAGAALALVISTATGLFISWKYARRKGVVIAVLLAGLACPVLLLFL